MSNYVRIRPRGNPPRIRLPARGVRAGPCRLTRVEEDRATRIVAALRDRGVMAHVTSPGVYRSGIRIVVGDGREALWDTDGTAGLEATVMRDGVLVGYVPQIAESESFDDDDVIAAIAATDYG